jgi:hypothetical protein
MIRDHGDIGHYSNCIFFSFGDCVRDSYYYGQMQKAPCTSTTRLGYDYKYNLN